MNRGMCGNNTTPSGSGDEPSVRSRPWENCLFQLRPPSPHILFNHMGSQAKSQQQRQCPTAKYCADMICTSDQNLRMCNLHNEECVFIIRLSDVKSIDNVSYFKLLRFRLTKRQSDHLTVEVFAATITGFSLRGTIMKPLTGSVRQSSAQNDAVRRICAITCNLAGGEDVVSILTEE